MTFLLLLFIIGSYVAVPSYWFLSLTERCRKENLKTAQELWDNIYRLDDEIPICFSIVFAPIAVIIMCAYWTLKPFKSALLGFIVAASRFKITITVTNESGESKDA